MQEQNLTVSNFKFTLLGAYTSSKCRLTLQTETCERTPRCSPFTSSPSIYTEERRLRFVADRQHELDAYDVRSFWQHNYQQKGR